MLKLTNVNKTLGNSHILKHIDVTFNKGETTVILGPSGSGKSTLLRILNLLEVPDSGTLATNKTTHVFPKQLSFPELKSHRQNLGIVFQSFNLFPHLNVIQNIMSGPLYTKKEKKQDIKEKAEALLDKIGLSNKKTAYPNNLSGGQMQRVAIARALIMEPEFMLYDEPTSALDPELAQEIFQLISQLSHSDNGQIIVSHHIAFAKKVADRILFLDEGSIIFDGTASEFFQSNEERIQKYLKQIL